VNPLDQQRRESAGPAEEAAARERFERSVLPHLDAAWGYARHLMRDPDDAGDAVQEAFLRAWRHFDGFRGAYGRAWLLTIVRNTCLTHVRRRSGAREQVPFEEESHVPDAPMPGPEAALARRRAGDSVHTALAELSGEFREVIVLRELEDLSYREIAQVVGAPIGTVMSRLSRARRQLACALRSAGPSEEPNP